MAQIFNISSSLPFLESLAKGVTEKFGNLQDVTIYLPNRRASRPLAEVFFKLAGEKSLILPRIEVIGDVDEEELYLQYFPEFEHIPAAIGSTQRLYEIARLIHEKDGEKRPDFAQSVALAKSLIHLIDELQNKNLTLDSLNGVVPEDFAEHWQVTLDFLKIISEDWQEFLREKNLLEPIIRRNILINKLAEHYRANPPQHPVIIAGTTGTIPATVELIRAVLEGENGYLVLNGLDRNLREEDYKILEETHPQFNLSGLLKSLKAESVEEWEEVELTSRQRLISTAMFPTERTPEWKSFKCDGEDLRLIEAANLEEEAMAISMALREVLEEPEKKAMVVTNNRQLAERISAKMKIWDVEINDSAGQNLAHLPTSTFLLELLEMLRSRQAPVQLLNFFKHPFMPTEYKNQIRAIELKHLHGPRIEGFDVANYGIQISELKELAQMFEKTSVNLKAFYELHIKIAEQIATPEKLWGGRGLDVYEFLREFKSGINAEHAIDPQLYPEILAQFISTGTYRPPYGSHPRIDIFSPSEARMQNADLVVLAGMNEGGMPSLPQQDSFMNQQIRKTIGLDLLSRKIGQSAHDFELLSQAPSVIYTRSLKEGGSPSIKSRFLQRLQAVCEVKSGDKYCQWAKAYYQPAEIKASKRPEPRPPIEARPRELSATRVGNLMRDPYVVYAEKILRLRKLADIDEEATASKFGMFIHKSLELFSKDYDGKLQTLIAIGEAQFKEFENKLGARIFWWPKFLRIAEWFVENEKEIRATGKKFEFEEKGEVIIGKMKFTAEADRVEIDGYIKIIDYKTGNPPTWDGVEAGRDPQLAIEAIIFGDKHNMPISALEYWYLVGRDEAVTIRAYNNEAKVTELVDAARKGLEQISEVFLQEKTPFLARPWSRFAMKYNDYEHLARIKEWDE